MHAYTVYGVGIESNIALGALPRLETGTVAVRMEIAHVDSLQTASKERIKLCQAQGRNVYVVAEKNFISVGVGSFLWFDMWPDSGRISGQVLKIVPETLLHYWVIQQIIPLLLLWNGSTEFLHGMSVSTQAEAGDTVAVPGSPCMAFLGDSFAGKSTLLGYFLSRGHILVSDDHLAVARRNYSDVLPASPYYRPYRAGEDLGFVSPSFSPAPRPLKRLFLLEPAPAYADIELQELTGIAAVSALLPHIQYNIRSPNAPYLFSLVEERFRGLASLTRQVPIKRLYVPRAMDRLPEVYDLLQRELAS